MRSPRPSAVAAAVAFYAALALPFPAAPVRADDGGDVAIRAAAADPRGAAYAHLMRALLAVRRGEGRLASDEIDSAVALQPESAALRIQAAELLTRLGRRQDAREMGESALALQPESTEALRFLGDLAAERALAGARPDDEARVEALGYYGRLTALTEVDGDVLWKIAGLRLQGGDRAGAIEAGQALVEQRPGDRGAAGSLAKWLLEEGRDLEALDVVLDYVAAHPDDDVFVRLADDLTRRNDAWSVVVERLGDEAVNGVRSNAAQQLVGEALFRAGRADDATRALERAYAIDPSDRELRFRLANGYRDLGRLADAAVLARQLVEEAPAEPEARLLLAETLRAQVDIDGAVAEYGAALGLLESDPDPMRAAMRDAVRARMAGALLAGDRIDEARALTARLEFPAAAEAVELRVQIALAGEDWAAARSEAGALRALGQNGFAALVTGEIALGSGDDARAGKDFDRAVDILGDRIRARVAALWTDADRPERAAAALEAWLAAFPADAAVRFQAGAMFHDLGQAQRAEEELREAIRLDPSNAPALNYLGYSLAERGENLDEALSMIRAALAVDPWNGAYLDSLGWAFYMLGRYEDARDPLERAAREYPFDPTVLEHLGDTYHRLGRRDLALDAWRRAIDAGAEHPDTLRRKADALEATGGTGPDSALDRGPHDASPIRRP